MSEDGMGTHDSKRATMAPWKPLSDEPVAGDPHPIVVCESAVLANTPFPRIEYALQHDGSHLSDMQIETVRAIMQALRRHGVFGLGDGTGSGKGRVIAGVIKEWLLTHADGRVVWLSANQRLQRNSHDECTLLEVDTQDPRFVFKSYTANTRSSNNRSLVEHLRSGTAPLLICDECHLLRTQRVMFESLQRLIHNAPDIAVLYSSATMMSDPVHLCYLSPKFGLHSIVGAPFASDVVLRDKLRGGGAAMMELVSMFLRAKGLYMCRQLDMSGVRVESHTLAMTHAQRSAYDRIALALKQNSVPVLRAQRVLFNLVTSYKVEGAMRIADEALHRGSSVIFTFVYTGEASTERAIRSDALAPQSSIVHALEALLPMEAFAALDLDPHALNPIDAIIDRYGAERVAEITGRTRRLERVAQTSDEPWRIATIQRQSEVDAFQAGTKRIAILSRAGGIGLSLHDTGHGRRENVVVELPWSSEDFVQIVGRSHRSASVTAPAYTLCAMDVPSEARIAYTLARRIQSMGALTRGDRNACDVLSLGEHFGQTTTAHARRTFVLKMLLHKTCDEEGVNVVRDIKAHAPAIDAFLRRHKMLHANASTVGEKMLKALCFQPDDMVVLDEEDVGHEEATFAQRYMYVLAACTLFAGATIPALVPWSPETHATFGANHRRIVLTVLMTHAHIECRHTLGLLPDSLILEILRMALWEGDDIALVSDYWPRHATTHACMKGLCASHESFLNGLLYMNVETQRAAQRVMDTSRRCELTSESTRLHRRHRGSTPSCANTNVASDLLRVVEGRAGPGVAARIESVTSSAPNDGLVTVKIAFDVAEPPTPESTAIFWKNARSGVLCWTVDERTHAGVTIDGTSSYVDDYTHIRIPKTMWENASQRRLRFLEDKARRLHRHYVISTFKALHDWDESLKRVVTVPATQSSPAVVGLLVNIH